MVHHQFISASHFTTVLFKYWCTKLGLSTCFLLLTELVITNRIPSCDTVAEKMFIPSMHVYCLSSQIQMTPTLTTLCQMM